MLEELEFRRLLAASYAVSWKVTPQVWGNVAVLSTPKNDASPSSYDSRSSRSKAVGGTEFARSNAVADSQPFSNRGVVIYKGNVIGSALGGAVVPTISHVGNETIYRIDIAGNMLCDSAAADSAGPFDTSDAYAELKVELTVTIFKTNNELSFSGNSSGNLAYFDGGYNGIGAVGTYTATGYFSGHAASGGEPNPGLVEDKRSFAGSMDVRVADQNADYKPDLHSTMSALPISVKPGDSIATRVAFQNTSDGDAENVTGRLYLSRDAVIDESDLVLGRTRTATLVAANSTVSFKATVTIPNQTKRRSYFVLVRADPDNAIFERNEANNDGQSNAFLISDISSPDLVKGEPYWNRKTGGLTVPFTLSGSSLSKAASVDLFWASGPNGSDVLESIPFSSERVSAGTLPGTYTVNFPFDNDQSDPPDNASHIVVRLDANNSVDEIDEMNNEASVPDVIITGKTIASLSARVLKGALRFAGNATASVSDTARTPQQQAQTMYDVLVGPFNPKTMSGKGKIPYKNTLEYSYGLYDAKGDTVIKVWADGYGSMSEVELVKAMTVRILEIRKKWPDAFKHISDPAKLQVFDVRPSSIQNKALFELALDADDRLQLLYNGHRFLAPPVDAGYHLQVPVV